MKRIGYKFNKICCIEDCLKPFSTNNPRKTTCSIRCSNEKSYLRIKNRRNEKNLIKPGVTIQ